MSEAREWRWVDPSGGQHVWKADALRNAFQAGSLPGNTLVWCEGMTDWLPASQVAELNPGGSMPDVRIAQTTLPGISGTAQEPGAALATRVGVPVDPAVAAAGTTLLGVPPPSPGSGPMPPNAPRAPIHPQTPPGQQPPTQQPGRPVGKGKTMVMGQPILDAAKLAGPIVVPGYQNPPGGRVLITSPAPYSDDAGVIAVPRLPLPPSGLEAPGGPASDRDAMGQQTGAPPWAGGGGGGAGGEQGAGPDGQAPKRKLPLAAVLILAGGVGLVVLVGGGLAVKAVMGSKGEPEASGAGADGAGAPRSSGASAGSVLPAATGPGPAASAGAGASAGAAASAASAASAGAGAASAGAARAAASGQGGEGAGGACVLAKAAKKLAPRASKDIPLEVVGVPGAGKMAVGFSADGRAPQALELDAVSLATTKAAAPRAAGKLRRVLPIPQGNKTRWVADGDTPRAKLQKAQTVPLEPSFLIGIEGGSVAASEKATASPQRLWAVEGGAAEAIRVAAVPGEGAVVAVRTKDSLFAGLVGPDRSAKGDLIKLLDAGQAGSPSPAGGPSGTAVAFAFRGSDPEPWSLRIARAERGAPLAKAAAFALPAGGPGQDAMSPSLAALPGGGWLLVWAEGKLGGRVIRGQTLSASLEPVGSPVTLSQADLNAGQPVVAVADGRAVVIYLSSAGKGFELWGASLTCP